MIIGVSMNLQKKEAYLVCSISSFGFFFLEEGQGLFYVFYL